MTVDTQSQLDIQNDFRLRALGAEAALLPLAIIVFITSKFGAPLIPRPDQLVGAGPSWMDGSEYDRRKRGTLDTQILSGASRRGHTSDIYSYRLGLGPVSAPRNSERLVHAGRPGQFKKVSLKMLTGSEININTRKEQTL